MSRRRHEVTYIDVDHGATAALDRRREWARDQAAAARQPAAWEAAPEPEPAPQPKPGRGSRIVVATQPPGAVVLDPDEARAVKRALSELEQGTAGTARTAASRARQTLNRRTRGSL